MDGMEKIQNSSIGAEFPQSRSQWVTINLPFHWNGMDGKENPDFIVTCDHFAWYFHWKGKFWILSVFYAIHARGNPTEGGHNQSIPFCWNNNVTILSSYKTVKKIRTYDDMVVQQKLQVVRKNFALYIPASHTVKLRTRIPDSTNSHSCQNLTSTLHSVRLRLDSDKCVLWVHSSNPPHQPFI